MSITDNLSDLETWILFFMLGAYYGGRKVVSAREISEYFCIPLDLSAGLLKRLEKEGVLSEIPKHPFSREN